eukprot:INCI1179.1.p1 GENE.INCI1179.1~~INCI1179.1.p1  ORF type:complete len:301 (-),score=66.28 INCI1179.1:64-966(-)
MLFRSLSEEVRWGRFVQRPDVESCLLKAAAAGHWVAALDACATLKKLAGSEQTGTVCSDTAASASATSSDGGWRCCVDSAGRSAVNVAADHGHWLTAWVLGEKAQMQVSHPDDEQVLAAVQRGAKLAAQLRAEADSAKQAAIEAEKSSGPKVIQVDDDLPPEDGGHDSGSGSDAGFGSNEWDAYEDEIASLLMGKNMMRPDKSKKCPKKKKSKMVSEKFFSSIACSSSAVPIEWELERAPARTGVRSKMTARKAVRSKMTARKTTLRHADGIPQPVRARMPKAVAGKVSKAKKPTLFDEW